MTGDHGVSCSFPSPIAAKKLARCADRNSPASGSSASTPNGASTQTLSLGPTCRSSSAMHREVRKSAPASTLRTRAQILWTCTVPWCRSPGYPPAIFRATSTALTSPRWFGGMPCCNQGATHFPSASLDSDALVAPLRRLRTAIVEERERSQP